VIDFIRDIFLSLIDPDFLGTRNFWLTLIIGTMLGVCAGSYFAKLAFRRNNKEKIAKLEDEIAKLNSKLEIKEAMTASAGVRHTEPNYSDINKLL